MAVSLRDSVAPLQGAYVPEDSQLPGGGLRQALRIVRMSTLTYLYVSQRKDENVLKARIREIRDTRLHYGSTAGCT